jgi:hypothetical protein
LLWLSINQFFVPKRMHLQSISAEWVTAGQQDWMMC